MLQWRWDALGIRWVHVMLLVLLEQLHVAVEASEPFFAIFHKNRAWHPGAACVNDWLIPLVSRPGEHQSDIFVLRPLLLSLLAPPCPVLSFPAIPIVVGLLADVGVVGQASFCDVSTPRANPCHDLP